MPRVSSYVRLLAVLLLVLAGVAATGTTPARAATQDITVSLYRVVELSCDEGAGEACGNDYYPKFEIDHQGLFDGRDTYCCGHGSDFRTNWVYTATVDTSHNPVDIQMQLWDQDDLTQDDPIHWTQSGSADLNLRFDLNTCTFTGGGLTSQQGADMPTLAGESEGSGEDSARGYFTITTPSCVTMANTADSDGDGIMNTWEVPGKGLDFNNDGTVDLPLGDEPYGAVPYRKDLFVEADYMTADKPQPGALDDVVKAFAAAPVDEYPDPSDPTKKKYRGINLHTTEDESLPNVALLRFESDGPGTLDDFNDLKHGNPAGSCTGFFGTPADRSSPNCANILQAKRQVYRYMIFGNSYVEMPGSSGDSEWDTAGPPRGGNDFMVTLGSWAPASFTSLGGRKNAEASTFMHELGHTLSLGHGGDDAINCKPNYLSVMNYTLQFADNDASRPLDYSSTAKQTALGTTPTTTLNETGLNENNGVYGTPSDPPRSTVYGVGASSRPLPPRAAPSTGTGRTAIRRPVSPPTSTGSRPSAIAAPPAPDSTCTATTTGPTSSTTPASTPTSSPTAHGRTCRRS